MRRSLPWGACSSLAVIFALLACGTSGPSGALPLRSAVPSSTAPTVGTTRSTARPNRRIALPHLPPQGLAIEHQGTSPRVTLANLHGEVLVVLHRFALGSRKDPASARLSVRRGDHRYVLHPRRSMLVLAGRRRSRPTSTTDVPTEALPQPPGSITAGGPSGEYRWAAVSPDGTIVAAQWAGFVFGSCQTSSAYLLAVEGGAATPVMGPARIGARPTSFAIGWTRNDRALVMVPGVGCAGREDVRPGIYGFSSPGRGGRIMGSGLASAVQMWRPGAARPRSTTAPPDVDLFRRPGDGRLLVRTRRSSGARMWGG